MSWSWIGYKLTTVDFFQFRGLESPPPEEYVGELLLRAATSSLYEDTYATSWLRQEWPESVEEAKGRLIQQAIAAREQRLFESAGRGVFEDEYGQVWRGRWMEVPNSVTDAPSRLLFAITGARPLPREPGERARGRRYAEAELGMELDVGGRTLVAIDWRPYERENAADDDLRRLLSL